MQVKSTKITFEWTIQDNREPYGLTEHGVSTIVCVAQTKIEALNNVIEYANDVPLYEIKRNGIDVSKYKDEKWCRYHKNTKLYKIIKIEKVMEEIEE